MKNERMKKNEEKTKNKKSKNKRQKKSREKKKEEKKEKRAQRGTPPLRRARKLIFYIRTVKRNCNEIEAQKKSDFQPPQKENEKEKEKAVMALQSYSSSHTSRPWTDEAASSQRNGQSEPCFSQVRQKNEEKTEK